MLRDGIEGTVARGDEAVAPLLRPVLGEELPEQLRPAVVELAQAEEDPRPGVVDQEGAQERALGPVEEGPQDVALVVEREVDVVEVDDDVPNLLGQIPLEYLDLVVDPRGQKLIPNPEHGDKQMSEEY